LPAIRAPSRRVAAEGRRAEARELLLARLAAPAPAQLDGVAVDDAGVVERCDQRSLVELRVPPRAREAADVDQRLDVRFFERFGQLGKRANPLADGVRQHTIFRPWV